MQKLAFMQPWEKAIENYRKIKEGKEELTEKELEALDKQCEAIRTTRNN